VWGGNRGDALDAETGAVRASLFSRACDGRQGGDIYYFSVCSTGELTRVAIVDVMGHGVAVSDTSQWLYESLVRHMNSPDNAAVLTDLNRASVDKGYEAMSTAAVAAFYRSDRSLCFSYAGHHELLLKRRAATDWVPISGGELEAFGGIPLGVDARATFAQHNIALSAGDRLLLYTDGITEAPNADDEQFGLERLVETLKATSGRQLEHIRTNVLDALRKHTANSLAHDDVTFIVLEVVGDTEYRALKES
jgi:sigma-B regulation protein RsbU (phosphoserine phosphatase)